MSPGKLFSFPARGRETLKAITVQHSPLLRAKPGSFRVREASGLQASGKVRSPHPTGYTLREGLAASIRVVPTPGQPDFPGLLGGLFPQAILLSLMPGEPNPHQCSPVSGSERNYSCANSH